MKKLFLAMLLAAAITGGISGAWLTKNAGSTYRAEADGLIIAHINADNISDKGKIIAYSDSSATPTTMVAMASSEHWDDRRVFISRASLNFIVKKDDYYKIVATNSRGECPTTIFWLPIIK